MPSFFSKFCDKELEKKKRHKHLDYHRNKEEAGCVDEADNIDKHLHGDHKGPGDEKDWGCKTCHWSKTPPVPFVVFVYGMDHCEEGYGHGEDDVSLKIESKRFVVFLQQPVEPDSENTGH